MAMATPQRDTYNKHIWQTSQWDVNQLVPTKAAALEYKTISNVLMQYNTFTLGDFTGGYGLFGLVIQQDFDNCDITVVHSNHKEYEQCNNLTKHINSKAKILKQLPTQNQQVFDITLHGIPIVSLLKTHTPTELAAHIAMQTRYTTIVEYPSHIHDPIAAKILGNKLPALNDFMQALLDFFQISDCQPLIGIYRKQPIYRMCYILQKK